MTPAIISAAPLAILRAAELLEAQLLALNEEIGGEVELPLHQQLHDGIYTRTLWQPKGTILVAAKVRVPTTIILDGDQCVAGASENPIHFKGRQVLAAAPGRKVVVMAFADSVCTVCYRTNAATVAEAEQEYTDEWAKLQNNRSINTNILEN